MNSASAVVEFKVNYEQAMDLPEGKTIHSDAISAGGYMWRINLYFYLRGRRFRIYLELLSKSSVKAIFEVLLIDKDYGQGQPVLLAALRPRKFQKPFGHILMWHISSPDDIDNLIHKYVNDGYIKFLCTIRVLPDNPIPVPPSDIVKHLGTLLDTADGTDVAFAVDGETFHAHRAVLAARSPVFRAELLGSMAEATMPHITLHDIAPATFKVMLQYMYTDALPGDDDLGDAPTEMLEHLLAAADRYALERLKLLCAQKLWDNVSADTVATTLACAEMYSCPELKQRCIGFFAVKKNFMEAVLTEGFDKLVQLFPSIILELRDSVKKW
jgi:speckle-type POZ protein